VNLIGGELAVTSHPGHGTTIRASVPISTGIRHDGAGRRA
jgi:chemotaxis protein histidine kinase CheA